MVDLRTRPDVTIDAKQFVVAVHPDLPPTTVWGYELPGSTADRSTYLGPTLVAQRGTPVAVTFDNQLPTVPLFPTDPALVPHGAIDSRIHTHLHGGRIADTEDGNPFDAYGDLSTGQPEVSPARPRRSTTPTSRVVRCSGITTTPSASHVRTCTPGWRAATC